MLIEVPYKEGDTISIKLTSGEELIGRLDKEEGNNIVLHKPLMVAVTQQGLGLAPFMFTVNPDSKIKINTDRVVCIVKSDSEFSKQYISNTTGITL